MKIREIINEIDKQYLFIPAFQREYVWKRKDAKKLINSAFGKDFTSKFIQVYFPTVDDEEICVVDIEPGNSPLYIDVTSKSGIKQRKFFVRSGNASQDLDIDEAATYIQNRFGNNLY